MKQITGSLAVAAIAASLIACNDGTPNATNADDTTRRDNTDTNSTMSTPSSSATPSNTPTGAPLSAKDSTFVMKAAVGGMLEVESSNLALQNATNDRVKAFATMMVNDHTKANEELKALATGRGMMLPTTLPPDKQMHIDGMKKMQGKGFDKHYVKMMMDDHKKDVSEFEMQSTGGNDEALKAFAAKTLPVLKMHRDSVMALSKMKM